MTFSNHLRIHHRSLDRKWRRGRDSHSYINHIVTALTPLYDPKCFVFIFYKVWLGNIGKVSELVVTLTTQPAGKAVMPQGTGLSLSLASAVKSSGSR